MKRVSVSGLPGFVPILAILLGLYCTVVGIVGLFDPTGVPEFVVGADNLGTCLLYTSPSPRDATLSRMPSSA